MFSGRYKALIVDGSGSGYLKSVCDYVHLNPVRANLLLPDQPLREYWLSSYPLFLKKPSASGCGWIGGWVSGAFPRIAWRAASSLRCVWRQAATPKLKRIISRQAGIMGRRHFGRNCWRRVGQADTGRSKCGNLRRPRPSALWKRNSGAQTGRRKSC